MASKGEGHGKRSAGPFGHQGEQALGAGQQFGGLHDGAGGGGEAVEAVLAHADDGEPWQS
jgi:hypothetical protein